MAGADHFREWCDRSQSALPRSVVHSPLLRTTQTAELLYESLRLGKAEASDLLVPGRSDYADGAYLDFDQTHQLVVGHQPYLSWLIDVWCDADRLPPLMPGGFAVLSLLAPSRGGAELLMMCSEGGQV